MSEHQLYRDHRVAWVFYLATKYMKEGKYRDVISTFKAALTEEEIEAARIMWREENQ